MVSRWKAVGPNDFRGPVDYDIVRAVLSILIYHRHVAAAACVMMMFFCLVRLGEVEDANAPPTVCAYA